MARGFYGIHRLIEGAFILIDNMVLYISCVLAVAIVSVQ